MEQQQTEINIANMQCMLIMDEKSPEYSRSFSHVHPSYELFYVWKGEVEIKTERKTYKIRGGQAALISPSLYHHTFTKDGTEKFNLFFSFAKNGRRKCEDVYSEFLRVFSGKPIQTLKAKSIDIEVLRDLRKRECFCREERLRAELIRFLFTLYDVLNKRVIKNQTHNDFTNVGMHYRYEIDRLLSKNYKKDTSLDEMAESLYISPKRLSVIIKSLYGKGYKQLKSEMRIQYAKQLLKESDMSIAAISQSVGYKSVRGFLIAFEEQASMTPTEYRNSN